MSASYHKPTHTLKVPAGDLNGRSIPYNPTEVRLYGLYAPFYLKPQQKQTLKFAGFNVEINIESTNKGGKSKYDFHNSAIQIKSQKITQGIFLLVASLESEDVMECGIIYGYAYEGHCYDLPKPKVMLIPAQSIAVQPDDCGYDKKTPEYRVWVVDKLDQCVEIEVNQGFVEQLVLDANMPGKRSPSTYRATMALSHRGGRLSE